jgi:3-isopropylmalate dehydrogenase
MKATIAMMPGDGIGPEVSKQAQAVLEVIAKLWCHEFNFVECPMGGAAIDALGEPLPQTTLDTCRKSDAMFLGAVGGPKWDHLQGDQRPEWGLLQLRKQMNLYANLRPVRIPDFLTEYSPLRPEIVRGTDLVVVRELTGGIYFGDKGRDENGAYDTCRYSREEVERIVHAACKIASTRRGKLTSVDKSNVMETSRMWREVVAEVTREHYPRLEVEYLLADAAMMHVLKRPADFDVIVTDNLFGDLLSDETSMLAGSMGLLASASLCSSGPDLFEPIHGSAPDIAGKNMANPYAAILSAAMLLRHGLNLEDEADAVEYAVGEAMQAGCMTRDLAPAESAFTTEEVGNAVVQKLEDLTDATNFTACHVNFTL